MSPAPPGRPRSPFSRRLGMYFLGIAIGLVVVGFLLSVRQLMGPTPPAPAPAESRP